MTGGHVAASDSGAPNISLATTKNSAQSSNIEGGTSQPARPPADSTLQKGPPPAPPNSGGGGSASGIPQAPST